jgi:peptide chain release factor 3
VPMSWPIGQGPTFQGVCDLVARQVLRFERTEHNRRQAPVVSMDLADARLDGALGAGPVRQLREEIELLSGAGARFDHDAFLSGKVTPVFFGSALTSFGVESFLAALLGLAPPPAARPSDRGLVEPTNEMFSGFIFKIQANMDPRHRDRMAFLRVCSGRFQRDMLVHHARLGRKIRITRPHRLFAREREMLAEAFPGDVVGLVNPGLFAIGDTLSTGAPLRFDAVPRFAPERFAILRCRTLSRQKQFHRGLTQLEEEGAIQVLVSADSAQRDIVLAAVGELQFDVVVARLAHEYGVETALDRLPYEVARHVAGDPASVAQIVWPYGGALRVRDRQDRLVALFGWAREAAYCAERNPDIVFRPLSETLDGVDPDGGTRNPRFTAFPD